METFDAPLSAEMVNFWALKTISKWTSFFHRKFCDMILDIISISFDENYSWDIVDTPITC